MGIGAGAAQAAMAEARAIVMDSLMAAEMSDAQGVGGSIAAFKLSSCFLTIYDVMDASYI